MVGGGWCVIGGRWRVVLAGERGVAPNVLADQQLLVVGAHIEHDREDAVRWDATGGTVESELADRDPHT